MLSSLRVFFSFFISFIYTELASFYPVAGGGHYYALRGSGDFWGSSLAGRFFFTLLLIVLNIKGVRKSSRLNEVLCAIDMVNESVIIILGFVFTFKPDLFLHQITHYFPPTDRFLVFSILIYALAFSVLGVGSVGWKPLVDHMKDPIAYLARFLPIIGPVAGPFTAILTLALLYASANAGAMGYSRLTHSMSNLGILPEWFEAVHPRYRIPYRTILVFSGAVIIQLFVATLSSNALETLADMYAFGALTTYVLVIMSHLRLGLTDPYTPGLFKLWGNIKIWRNGETVDLPLLGLLALLGAIFFRVVIWTHHWARLLGSTWLIAGLILYFSYKKKNNFPLLGSLERD